MPFLLVLILQLLILTSACSHKMDKEAVGADDPCANAVGNGNEIIAGPPGPSGGDDDQVFRSLEVDPYNPDVVYLGTERNGIVKTSDGGITWRRLRRGLRHSIDGYAEVWDIAVSPFDSGLVLAATAGSPGPVGYPDSDAGVYRSADGGSTWARSNCGLTNSYALCVRFDPGDSAGIVLGIGAGKATFSALLGQPFDGALLFSNDGGLIWNPAAAPAGMERNVFWVLRPAGPGGFVTFGLCFEDTSQNLGFLRSEDGGRTWSAFAPSLRTKRITAFDVSADGRTLIAVERDAFKIRKSDDGGSSWLTLASQANGPVKISPSDKNIILFCGHVNAYRSINGLQSWDAVLVEEDRIDDVEFAPSKPNILYLATQGYGFYKSSDSGATWSHVINLRAAGILN